LESGYFLVTSFNDFAHPVSGIALERSNKHAYGILGYEVVTTGGSGFGVMVFIVEIERNFIARTQAIERLHKPPFFSNFISISNTLILL